ncbi:hypothetical protein IEQ34_007320 [Dendrobium chrysotoxum]|uniref:Uncharacterized protein n=1 Tax=Dendrobium chrysotoxum TaxID=161865 RepID=A0AAV7GSV7_DENCH|nr:hypothetical protein IEQ34_007320 [Dendrobium chrysotoxum]
MKGVEREGGARRGADEGVEEEGVRAWDRGEEAAGVEREAGGDDEGEEFGEEGTVRLESRDDDAGVDLGEGADAVAGEEEGGVERGMRRRGREVWFHVRAMECTLGELGT